MNQVTILGRIGKDPEHKTFGTDNEVCNISVATDESYKKQDGTKVEQTEWHNVVFYGKLAGVINKFFKKGNRILVTGKLRTRSWDDKEGVKRYTTEINASGFEFIDKAEVKQEYTPPTPVSANSGDDDIPF